MGQGVRERVGQTVREKSEADCERGKWGQAVRGRVGQAVRKKSEAGCERKCGAGCVGKEKNKMKVEDGLKGTTREDSLRGDERQVMKE